MKKVAIVDIGSNTVKLLLYRVSGEKIKKLLSISHYVRLMNYIREGVITEKGIERLKFVLEEFEEVLRGYNPDCVLAVATHAIRVAKNREQVLEKLSSLFQVEVLSGEEEAYYSAVGALLDVKLEKGLLFDIGGGSLEICEVLDGQPGRCRSYSLGTLSFGEDASHIDVRFRVREQINPYSFSVYEADSIVGVGGSIRALKKVFGKRRIKRKKLKQVVDLLLNMTSEQISEKFSIPLERAKTVTVAAVVAEELLDIFKAKELIISKTGLREGLIYERVVKHGEC